MRQAAQRQLGTVVATLGLLTGALLWNGTTALATVLVLGALEITLSFDNAVLNAAVLSRMSPRWQRAFLTLGVLVAVVGVRLVLPLLMVAVTARITPFHAWDLALRHPRDYQSAVAAARPGFASFGAAFLLVASIEFFAATHHDTWLRGERWLAHVGSQTRVRRGVGTALATSLLVLFLAGQQAAAVGAATGILSAFVLARVAGRMGAGLDTAVVGAGLGSFLYLEVLDASVSVDGVMGAFAITTDVVVMALGLGLGAVYVRSLTVSFARSHRMQQLAYLEHGAYYAIGTLGLALAASFAVEVPSLAIATTELVVIGGALVASLRAARRTSAPALPAAAGSVVAPHQETRT